MSIQQFDRRCSLIVADDAGNGLDLSALRIKFKVKKTDNQTPNKAEMRIWNLSDDTAHRIQKEFTQVQLSAGYKDNYGVIFKGNIKQIFLGKENGVDTYLDIISGDGDKAYNFTVINTTLAAGASHADQVQAVLNVMAANGIVAGSITGLGNAKLPRGKVMYGMARDYLQRIAESTNTTWSIQNGQLQFVPNGGLLPGEAIIINSQTGMVGAPEQTNKGIKVRCLLNPILKVAGKIQLNESDVIAERSLKIDGKNSKKNNYKPKALASDGVYRLIVVEYVGDNRGHDWFSELVCLAADTSAQTDEQVDVTEAGAW